MYNLVSLETAKKLKKIGVAQESLYYYYMPYVMVDKQIYTSMCNPTSKELQELLEIQPGNWVVPVKEYKEFPIHKTKLPEFYVEKVSAFNLSELIRLYGEDIKIPHDCKNYTEHVARQLIDNLNEVNKVFGS